MMTNGQNLQYMFRVAQLFSYNQNFTPFLAHLSKA